MQDIETFKEKLKSLISKFEKDKHHYLSKGYLEAQLRIDFLNPLFEALGWDIENKAHKPPQDRDVIVELSPDTTGRPDYNFRINGATKFFIEAKSPSVALDDVNHILQAKTYAWSTKEVYFVILTDFEEFKLFDASLKPNSRYPNEGLIFDFKYTDYLKNIDKLYNLSKEEVEKGSLEKLLPRDVKSKRLRIPVDKAFLEDMTAWREELAKDIYKRNPQIDVKVLNEVVQKLLDRIVFIRIAEDRKIRDANELKDIVELWRHEGKRKPILNHLKDLFYEVNDDLNGDIFKPHACESIDVDSNLLADIIENLYFPKCRYRFDVIGVELLGSIYERYLGSTIRVTPQRIKVEEKPEVRKAGGVYYTPKYIVEYIVKNTVGKLIEGKAPKQIEKIKILDPACGSGSFLLGAYQYLLDYHLKYYREHPKEAQLLKSLPLLYYKQLPEDITLPLHEKAKILRNNIFGVDIDPQAVEITMMSLYLKALEGERGLLPRKQHLLPPLTNNIKCGNSLIGYDIFEDSPLLRGVRGVFSPLTEEGEGEFSDETKSRINPFDWKSKTAGFGEIMENGGFDCVIGNPPYGAELTPQIKEYFVKKYVHQNYQFDSYLLFMEKTIGFLRENGFWGMIIPNTWLTNLLFKNIRKFMTEQTSIKNIVHFLDKVFAQATVDTEIIITQKATPKNNKCEITIFEKGEVVNEKHIAQKKWQRKNGDVINIFIDDKTEKIINKITKVSRPLANLCKVTVGIKPYQKGKGKPSQTEKVVKERIYDATHKKNDTYRKYLRGKDINRYIIEPIEKRWISYGDWLAEPRYTANFDAKEKIFIRQTGDRPIAAIDFEQYLCLNNMHVITPTNDKYDLRYILACINSRLLDFFYETLNPEKGEALAEVKKENVEKLLIRTIDFKNSSEKAVHDKLVSLVDRMLDLHKNKNSLPPSAEREKVEREIAVIDEKIDEIVYGLYGVTEEERKVIEG
ncbi:MAG: N-6 DNA methylase [Nitrospirota bacterium]